MTDDPYQAGGQPPPQLPSYSSFNPWAAPGSGQPPYGAGGPPPRSRSPVLVWVAAIAVVAVLLSLVGGGLLLARHHSASTVAAAASVTPQPTPPSTPSGSSAGSAAPSRSAAAPSAAAPSPAAPAPPTAPAAGAPPDAGSGPLDSYVLSPAEEGPGAMMFLIDGGRGITLDQPTLDFCNFTYTSEKLRTARVQVQYAGGSSRPAGNEFVKYSTRRDDEGTRRTRAGAGKLPGDDPDRRRDL